MNNNNPVSRLVAFYRSNPLSFRVLKYILLFSTVFAIFTTAVQLYTNYRLETGQLEDRLSDIEEGVLPTLRDSLWKYDIPSVQNALDSIVRLSYIPYIALDVPRYGIIEAGVHADMRYEERVFTIHYPLPTGENLLLGTLSLYIDRSGIIDNLLIQLWVTLLAQLLKTFTVSVFILIILHLLIMRHLSTLARFADNLSVKTLSERIVLPDRPRKRPDELDKLTHSMETMRHRLHKDLDTIRRARATEQKLISAIEASPSGILISSAAGIIDYVNESFTRITGVKPEIVLNRPLTDIDSHILPRPADRHVDLTAILEQVMQQGQWSGEAISTSPDDKGTWNYMVMSAIRDRSGALTHVLLIIDDITELKKSEETLYRQQNFDETTRLPNRRYGFDRLLSILDHARHRDRLTCLVVMSIREYQTIKENAGDNTAEQLIHNLAVKVQETLVGASLYARTAEDELLICLENVIDRNAIELELKKLAIQFIRPVAMDGQFIPVSPCAGIALFPADGHDVSELYKNALIAKNRALKAPVSYQYYSKHLGKTISREFSIATELKNAMPGGELTLNYQPIIDGQSLELHGYEVLLRWHNDSLGQVSPFEFISIAEQTGDIIPIGRWTLLHAIDQIQQIRGQTFTLSVNISPMQLTSPDFESMVEAILEKTGFDPKRLKFEITEESLIESFQAVQQRIGFIRETGIAVVLDDFGTGYSSLAYLQAIPFDVIKIDKGFIMDMDSNHKNARLARTIIDLAHDLDMKVTAEGVESEAHVVMLQSYTCDLLQGFHFAKPLPLEELLTGSRDREAG